jgi:hypothetical protein
MMDFSAAALRSAASLSALSIVHSALSPIAVRTIKSTAIWAIRARRSAVVA